MHESEKWNWSRSVVFDPQWPHGLQPTNQAPPPPKSLHGIFQARVLEWGAIAFSDALGQFKFLLTKGMAVNTRVLKNVKTSGKRRTEERNYKDLQKHCCSGPNAKHTWKPEQWTLLKLFRSDSWLLSTEIYVEPVAWVSSPAKSYVCLGDGSEYALKSAAFKTCSSELSGPVKLPHRSQDKCLHTTFKQATQLYCFMVWSGFTLRKNHVRIPCKILTTKFWL